MNRRSWMTFSLPGGFARKSVVRCGVGISLDDEVCEGWWIRAREILIVAVSCE